MEFADIHNHCAWDIDDGMPTREDAIEMLKEAFKDDIREIVATPHFIPGRHSKEDIQKMNTRIQELIVLGNEIGVRIYTGCEVFLNYQFLEMLDEELFNTIAGSGYVLCEFDVRKNICENLQANDILYEFEVRDMIPVIAHVERYFPKRINLAIVKVWHDAGYVIQVNRTSLLGYHGNVIKKNAWKLLDAGLVHVIATDTHRPQGHRICRMSDVYDLIYNRTGKENAELLCCRNPVNIIKNLPIEDMKLEKKVSLLKRIRRRG